MYARVPSCFVVLFMRDAERGFRRERRGTADHRAAGYLGLDNKQRYHVRFPS
jgi:hypothetical protein